MNTKEIAKLMLEFLNENGQYQNFLAWAEERGNHPDDLELDIEENIE